MDQTGHCWNPPSGWPQTSLCGRDRAKTTIFGEVHHETKYQSQYAAQLCLGCAAPDVGDGSGRSAHPAGSPAGDCGARPRLDADINAKGYHVGEIADDVFWITDGNYHSLLIVTPRGAIKAAFPDVRIIAQQETRDILESAGDSRHPVPDTVFRNTRSLAIGGKRIELHYFGNTHERGNIFVYLPEPKILMAVDIVYPG
jgi:hypothetical protein